MTHISPPPHTTHRPYVHTYARTHDTHRPTTQNTQAPHNPPLPDPLHIHILTTPMRRGFLPPLPDTLAPTAPKRAAPTHSDSPKTSHTARSDSTPTPIPYTYPHNNTFPHARPAAHPLLHALPPRKPRKTYPRPPSPPHIAPSPTPYSYSLHNFSQTPCPSPRTLHPTPPTLASTGTAWHTHRTATGRTTPAPDPPHLHQPTHICTTPTSTTP